jgi:hypothetical protein
VFELIKILIHPKKKYANLLTTAAKVLAAVINTESATFPLEKEKRSSEFPSMAYMMRKRKKGQTKKETEKQSLENSTNRAI